LLDYSGFELAAELQKQTGIHTAVENDANLGALAQLWLSEREVMGLKDFVFLAITSVGVGAGLILNRELYRGHDSSYAGEFGHMIIGPNGPPCSCGRAGCFELYVCDRATWDRYSPGTEFEVARFEDLIDAARQGDQRALTAFHETARYLSLGVSNIVLALNPEVVVLGGRLTRVWDLIRGTVEAGIRWLGFKASIRATQVNLDQLYLNGAISLALSKAFVGPKLGW
jgi:predicted NBD/HSP70 family sugar kinase